MEWYYNVSFVIPKDFDVLTPDTINMNLFGQRIFAHGCDKLNY